MSLQAPARKHSASVARSRSRRSVPSSLCAEKPKFTVLIGSQARRTAHGVSDIDVVRIGHRIPFRNFCKGGVVSYIDYDNDTFRDLYDGGSLFLYHVFQEGRLIAGNARVWRQLKEDFRVKTDFGKEIARNRKFLRWLKRGEKFRGAVIPYLAHTCRALKNLAIFSLAQKRRYVFDKRKALRRAFPRLSSGSIDLLIRANDSFERSSSPRLSSTDVEVARLNRLREQVTAAINNASR